jgi:hypothetical protein
MADSVVMSVVVGRGTESVADSVVMSVVAGRGTESVADSVVMSVVVGRDTESVAVSVTGVPEGASVGFLIRTGAALTARAAKAAMRTDFLENMSRVCKCKMVLEKSIEKKKKNVVIQMGRAALLLKIANERKSLGRST